MKADGAKVTVDTCSIVAKILIRYLTYMTCRKLVLLTSWRDWLSTWQIYYLFTYLFIYL